MDFQSKFDAQKVDHAKEIHQFQQKISQLTAERNEFSNKVADLQNELDEGAKTPEYYANFVGKWHRVYESKNCESYKENFGRGFLGWKTFLQFMFVNMYFLTKKTNV